MPVANKLVEKLKKRTLTMTSLIICSKEAFCQQELPKRVAFSESVASDDYVKLQSD